MKTYFTISKELHISNLFLFICISFLFSPHIVGVDADADAGAACD